MGSSGITAGIVSAVAGVAPGLEWNAGAVRSEGEVNSIFTAENAEDRRELQRENREQFCVLRIERAASASLLRSSALLRDLCGKNAKR